MLRLLCLGLGKLSAARQCGCAASRSVPQGASTGLPPSAVPLLCLRTPPTEFQRGGPRGKIRAQGGGMAVENLPRDGRRARHPEPEAKKSERLQVVRVSVCQGEKKLTVAVLLASTRKNIVAI